MPYIKNKKQKEVKCVLSYFIKIEDRTKRLHTWGCTLLLLMTENYFYPLKSSAAIPKYSDTMIKNHKPFLPLTYLFLWVYSIVSVNKCMRTALSHYCRFHYLFYGLQIAYNSKCYVIFSSLLLMSLSNYIGIRVLYSPCRFSLFLVQFQAWKSF